MTTSDNRTMLARPQGDAPVSERALGYVSASLRLEMYQLVLTAFREAKISQSTLAKRLGKRPEQVSRLLSGPGNWTIDTVAQLLFAIDGSLGRITQRWPDLVRRANYLSSTSSFSVAEAQTGTAGSAGAYTVLEAT